MIQRVSIESVLQVVFLPVFFSIFLKHAEQHFGSLNKIGHQQNAMGMGFDTCVPCMRVRFFGTGWKHDLKGVTDIVYAALICSYYKIAICESFLQQFWSWVPCGSFKSRMFFLKRKDEYHYQSSAQ